MKRGKIVNNVIIGNGVNIQSGGYDNYSNEAILKRIDLGLNTRLNIVEILENNCTPDNQYGYWDKEFNNQKIKLLLELFADKLSARDNGEWYLENRMKSKGNLDNWNIISIEIVYEIHK